MRRITPSIVVAVIAVVLASAGGATAASKLITGKQIKNSSITGADIKNESISNSDLSDSVLEGLKGDQGPQGPAGPQGAQGPQGPAGPTVVNKLTRVSAFLTVAAGDAAGGYVECPAGQGVVSGGFTAISADGEVFINDTLGATNRWYVGLDNLDSGLSGELDLYAYCAPAGQAISPRSAQASDALEDLVERRRKAHLG